MKKMIHNITKEDYINNPCGTCSIAYWKNREFEKPKSIKIIHEQNYNGSPNATSTKYFRLLHDLKSINALSKTDYIIQNVDVKEQKQLVADILGVCYSTKYDIETIDKWTKNRVFDNDLWIFAVEKGSGKPAALGIADFDSEIKEGSLEWIQVLPQYRKLGLGQLIVNELLTRLKIKADFVTVSGECDNETNPEMLYRKCGFVGDDIWYVMDNNWT